MGYTHYWDNPGFTESEWEQATDYAKRIIAESNVEVQFEYDEVRPMSEAITSDTIRFNGVEDEGHETFYLERKPSRTFGFCKTSMKPYDVIVVAMLYMLTRVNPRFSWSSDGDASDHVQGKELFYRSLDT